jgi:hypothetical protein
LHAASNRRIALIRLFEVAFEDEIDGLGLLIEDFGNCLADAGNGASACVIPRAPLRQLVELQRGNAIRAL